MTAVSSVSHSRYTPLDLSASVSNPRHGSRTHASTRPFHRDLPTLLLKLSSKSARFVGRLVPLLLDSFSKYWLIEDWSRDTGLGSVLSSVESKSWTGVAEQRDAGLSVGYWEEDRGLWAYFRIRAARALSFSKRRRSIRRAVHVCFRLGTRRVLLFDCFLKDRLTFVYFQLPATRSHLESLHVICLPFLFLTTTATRRIGVRPSQLSLSKLVDRSHARLYWRFACGRVPLIDRSLDWNFLPEDFLVPAGRSQDASLLFDHALVPSLALQMGHWVFLLTVAGELSPLNRSTCSLAGPTPNYSLQPS
ncbi:hypothetical protein BDV93DRAFT_66817 [Ceratobasidium sp. AG-I]|nr:hypothetical protein BDV93DRAFT_66817 [Ceratobasidium sp. AG-I]